MGSVSRLINIMNKSLQANAKAASAEENPLRKLANDFMMSCENRRFRNCKGFYTRSVSLFAAAEQFSLIEQIIEHQKKYPNIRNEGFASRLIGLYGESGMFNHARKLFDELPELNCPRTVRSFNALLNAGISAKKFSTVVEAFEALPRTIRVEPDLVSCNTVIHALCEMGSLEEAFSRFRELENQGKRPDVVTFNTLLDAVYKEGKVLEGERLWEMMVVKKVSPNVRSYNTRLRGMLRNGMVSEAVELVGEIEKNGIKCDSYTYNVVIRALCCNENFEEAKNWYYELQRSKCSPHLVSTYSIFASACLRSGDPGKAFEVCCDAMTHGLCLDAEEIERVVVGLSEKGMSEEALKLEKLASEKYISHKMSLPIAKCRLS